MFGIRKLLKGVVGASLTIVAFGQTLSGQEQQAPAAVQANQSVVTGKSQQFERPYGSHLNPILDKIKATADQRQKITAIVVLYKPRIDPLRQEYRRKSREFLNFIVTGMPAEKVMSTQGELNNLYGTIVTQYSLMRLEIRKLLTPEQCKLFEEYRRQQGWSANK